MKITGVLSLILLLLSACGRSRESEHAGGIFRMALDAGMATQHPAMVKDFYSSTVMSQVVEGLVSLDPENLKVRPQIAESYKISSDGTTYEFKIRKKVLFHPHDAFGSEDERILTGEDIVHSFELACKKDPGGHPSPAYVAIFGKNVLGAKAFHEGKARKISGISFRKQVLTIRLVAQDVNFLNKLAGVNAAITSRKVHASGTDDLIGTGPFLYAGTEDDPQQTIILDQNPEYYLKDRAGCNLPYLDRLEFIIEPDKSRQLALFESEQTDLITSLPTHRITSMLEGRIQDFNGVPPVLVLRNNPLLATNYYFFNMQDDRFRDVRVRQAFNYAVDRHQITHKLLLRQAYEDGIYGVVPPVRKVFQSYDFDAIRRAGYSYDPRRARQLLAEAGYPDGKGFGTVTLRFNLGDIQSSVADAFAKQISSNLGINVNIDGSSFEQTIRDASQLKGDLFKATWFADYNSPETFLQNFYGKLVPASDKAPSSINLSRYQNPAFDRYFEQARHQRKISAQLRYFNLAEQELLKDPPMIVLWYAGDNQLLYSKVRNLRENPMNYFYFREVYIQPWSKEEYQNHLMKQS